MVASQLTDLQSHLEVWGELILFLNVMRVQQSDVALKDKIRIKRATQPCILSALIINTEIRKEKDWELDKHTNWTLLFHFPFKSDYFAAFQKEIYTRRTGIKLKNLNINCKIFFQMKKYMCWKVNIGTAITWVAKLSD